nr:MAG TPA: Rep protein [Cressdnaviricota sp.]
MIHGQHKNWCFTINSTEWIKAENMMPIMMEVSKDERVKFLIFQLEKAKTEHIQGYLQVNGGKNGCMMSKIKEILRCPWVHLEVAKGTKKQNIEYCSKTKTKISETFIFGDTTSQGQRTDLESAANMIKEGKSMEEVALESPTIYCKYSKGLEKLKFILDKKKINEDIRREVTCEIYYGKGRTGKTYKATEDNKKSCYICDKKNNNNLWFDGYDNEQCLIIEEFSGDIPIDRLFRLLDGTKQVIEIKGNSTLANWTKVIITSNIWPGAWYPNLKQELKDSLIGRLNKLYYFEIPPGIIANKERYKHVTIKDIPITSDNLFNFCPDKELLDKSPTANFDDNRIFLEL